MRLYIPDSYVRLKIRRARIVMAIGYAIYAAIAIAIAPLLPLHMRDSHIRTALIFSITYYFAFYATNQFKGKPWAYEFTKSGMETIRPNDDFVRLAMIFPKIDWQKSELLNASVDQFNGVGVIRIDLQSKHVGTISGKRKVEKVNLIFDSKDESLVLNDVLPYLNEHRATTMTGEVLHQGSAKPGR